MTIFEKNVSMGSFFVPAQFLLTYLSKEDSGAELWSATQAREMCLNISRWTTAPFRCLGKRWFYSLRWMTGRLLKLNRFLHLLKPSTLVLHYLQMSTVFRQYKHGLSEGSSLIDDVFVIQRV